MSMWSISSGEKGNSGTGVWGTKLNDCYSPLGNEGTACTNPSLKNDSVLTMKVKIPGTWKSAKLQFYQWYDVNLYFDWTEIRVDGKVVGQTCTGSKPTSPTWKKRSVNLSKYAGKIITIKFIFMASTVVQYSGWYLDDLSITGS